MVFMFSNEAVMSRAIFVCVSVQIDDDVSGVCSELELCCYFIALEDKKVCALCGLEEGCKQVESLMDGIA